MAIRRIGQIFVDMGFIDDDQLEMLLEEQQQQPGEKLGKIAEEMGLITDDQLAQALAEQMNLQVINLTEANVPPDVLDLISETMAMLYHVIPVKFEDNTLTVATAEPQNLSVADELRTFLGYTIRLVVTTDREIKQALDRYYDAAGESVESIISELEDDEELLKQAGGLCHGRCDRSDRCRSVGRQCAGPQAAEYGAVAGHQGPCQRRAFRAL